MKECANPENYKKYSNEYNKYFEDMLGEPDEFEEDEPEQ